jgi:hypothetical protein
MFLLVDVYVYFYDNVCICFAFHMKDRMVGHVKQSRLVRALSPS